MKAGQQLVFGEQIGWFDPSVIQNPQNADFLRQVVGLRWQLRRFFYAGEMARPPKLRATSPRCVPIGSGTIPVGSLPTR